MRDAITGFGLITFGTIAVLALCIGVCALADAVIGCDAGGPWLRNDTCALGKRSARTIGPGSSVEILVADINMPGLSGVQLAERACGFRPELRVLLLSGRETDGHGFPVLQKPFSQPDLRRTMAKTIGLCD
jgi:hypothetical protein